MTYRIGDMIDPAEPPVGTVLSGKDHAGAFRIERDRRGWFVQGTRSRISWRAVISAWGPGAGQALTVVKLP